MSDAWAQGVVRAVVSSSLRKSDMVTELPSLEFRKISVEQFRYTICVESSGYPSLFNVRGVVSEKHGKYDEYFDVCFLGCDCTFHVNPDRPTPTRFTESSDTIAEWIDATIRTTLVENKREYRDFLLFHTQVPSNIILNW